MTSGLLIGAIVVAALILHALWNFVSRSQGQRARAVADDVSVLGSDLVPASLHPKIDPDRCIGSGSCVVACPEHDVIGLVHGRAKLVNPLACIGHGACAASCPVDAITLVFGSETRGVDVPKTDENFQTNQPGVFIVGELGGMGLIRNAVSQGRQAGDFIVDSNRRGGGDVRDAIVVGAGPAGISATLRLMEGGLDVVLLEREAYGGTITHYPRAKVVMTGVLDFAMYGQVKRRTMSKENLVDLWETIRTETNLPVVTGELVEQLVPTPRGPWQLVTSQGQHLAANVVLALGRRGSPRKLGVPGEEQSKVSYRLLEPDPYEGKHVLVVGGGNSAAECALALGEFGRCASVGISYRKAEFARVRAEVRDKLEQQIAAGRVTAHLPTEVDSIGVLDVTLRSKQAPPTTLPNDAVIVQIGGTSPTDILDRFGIHVVTKRGEA